MEIGELIWHFVIEASALTIATFVLLIIFVALIRLLGSPPKATDRPERNAPSRENELHPSSDLSP